MLLTRRFDADRRRNARMEFGRWLRSGECAQRMVTVYTGVIHVSPVRLQMNTIRLLRIHMWSIRGPSLFVQRFVTRIFTGVLRCVVWFMCVNALGG